MKTQKNDFTTLKVKMSKEKREKAKAFAKSQGYSFGFWIGKLINDAMQQDIRGQHK